MTNNTTEPLKTGLLRKGFLQHLSWRWLLVVWTVFLWISRIRNVLGNEDLDSSGRDWRLGVVAVFLILAAWAASSLMPGPRVKRVLPDIPDAHENAIADLVAKKAHSSPRSAVSVLAIWTLGFWAVRWGGILMGDYNAAFQIIHAILAVVSLALATIALLENYNRV